MKRRLAARVLPIDRLELQKNFEPEVADGGGMISMKSTCGGAHCGLGLIAAVAIMLSGVLADAGLSTAFAQAKMTVAAPEGNAALEFDPWPGIRKELFASRDITDEATTLSLEAPVRAEDAAIVPLTIRIPKAIAGDVKKLTLVIDKNPAPIAGVFTFGAGAGLGDRVISTRVRVDMYTNIRAIMETSDGKLHMVTKYVKAAGGCSAPALKDADEALAALGKMQLKTLAVPNQSAAMREGQVMIKHPNYSGMQMNQLTGLYIPAKYVQQLDVMRDGEIVFQLEGGISLSEDPNIRFTYGDGGTGVLEVTARDTDGSVFKARAAPSGS